MKAIKWILICMAVLYACCAVYALIPQKSVPVKELAGKDSRFIQVKDRTIHYIQAGQGKPLVLVHGFAGSTYTWRYLIPLLAQHNTVYALDLIGFGLSGCSFNLVLSAFSKLVPLERRGLALGAGTAAGSFGQFLFAHGSPAATHVFDSLLEACQVFGPE